MSFSNYGRWKKSIQVVSGSGVFIATGSNVGVEAVILGSGSPLGTIVLHDSGSITIADLTSGIAHELSIRTVEVTGGDHVYLLYSKIIT